MSREGSDPFFTQKDQRSPPLVDKSLQQKKSKLGISGSKKAKLSLFDDEKFGFIDFTGDVEREKLSEVERHTLVIEAARAL